MERCLCFACTQRVVVIGVSILFFETEASQWNIVGTTIALSGVFAYSMATRVESQDRSSRRGVVIPELSSRAAVEAQKHQVIAAQLLDIVHPPCIKKRFISKKPGPKSKPLICK
eukprot:1185927-Prorocentrum_minimum.AAC.3